MYVCTTLPAVRARLLALVVAFAAVAAVPAGALADGDPASDVLIQGTLYTPVAQKISPPVLQQVPQLFGHPKSYVKLLSAELFYVWKGAVIAVQPAGVGVANIKPLAPAQAAADTSASTTTAVKRFITRPPLLTRVE